MDMDIDDEYEEEEYLLYVDVDPTSLTEEQVRDSLDIKTFGLDTNKPLLQINNQFYEGKQLKVPRREVSLRNIYFRRVRAVNGNTRILRTR